MKTVRLANANISQPGCRHVGRFIADNEDSSVAVDSRFDDEGKRRLFLRDSGRQQLRRQDNRRQHMLCSLTWSLGTETASQLRCVRLNCEHLHDLLRLEFRTRLTAGAARRTRMMRPPDRTCVSPTKSCDCGHKSSRYVVESDYRWF